MSSRRAVILAAAAVALVATSCSNSASSVNKRPHVGDSTASVVDGIQQVTVTTGSDYRFHPSTIVVHPGRVRVILVNRRDANSSAPHNFSVQGLPGAFVPLTAAGQTQAATFTAPAPGRYTFVCTIHVAQGQTGVLIVKPGEPGS
ncbi:MAG TPA: cupredoxin domain-containing protein [Jatrophihabitans sp.]|jgi:plastocyanin|uniref:cupredoxin domain-containing protein n=1 Tax=Jatrophihabitans sp. TaxID=1932789 RepID=UPI002E0206CA|nr:cupredoxin domain-containing protein [Jatrophihabitans sp.]